jgi:hypothetical protein
MFKQKTGDAAKRLRADCALSGSAGGLFKTSVKLLKDNPRPTRRSNPLVKYQTLEAQTTTAEAPGSRSRYDGAKWSFVSTNHHSIPIRKVHSS